ncbi:MAG TPA: hypothetical protein VGM90_31430 [Kofleriaceae bacterium]
MRSVVVLLVCVGCNAVDVDLLAQTASPCDLGEVGAAVDVTPPDVVAMAPDPGVRGLVMDPFDASVFYASTHEQGVWRTANCGATWEHTNNGINAPAIENSEPIDFAIDPVVPDTLYISPRFGGNSIWWSTNAGVSWDNIVPTDVAMQVIDGDRPDVAFIGVDPAKAHHIFATSMVAWRNAGSDSGVLEGELVDDTWQWKVHAPAVGMGVMQYIQVLDAKTWLLTSNRTPVGEGTWVTHDGGVSFQRVDDAEAASAWQFYQSPDGTMYRPYQDGLLRSGDGGATWVDVFAGLGLGGTEAIIGDGTTLYASSSIPDGDSAKRLFTAPETPGDRGWVPLGEPTTGSVWKFLRDGKRDVLYTLNPFQGIERQRMR